MINNYELVTKISMNVLFISLFIAIFYFTYAPILEKHVIEHDMDLLCYELLNTSKVFGSDINKLISENVNNIKLPDLSHDDFEIDKTNRSVINNVVLYNIIFIIIVLVLIYLATKYSKESLNLSEIVTENIIILIFVGFIEFSFITFFGSRYVTIDPNKTKLSILSSLRKYNYI